MTNTNAINSRAKIIHPHLPPRVKGINIVIFGARQIFEKTLILMRRKTQGDGDGGGANDIMRLLYCAFSTDKQAYKSISELYLGAEASAVLRNLSRE